MAPTTANSSDGSIGVDYATLRLGNDSMFGYDGDDRLVGHGGADSLDGGAGDDLFEIGGFGTSASGTTSKADDGKAEWIRSRRLRAAAKAFRTTAVTNGITNAADYGGKIDIVVGGAGYDTPACHHWRSVPLWVSPTVRWCSMTPTSRRWRRSRSAARSAETPMESAYQQLLDGDLYFARSSTVSDTATSAGGTAGNSISNNALVIDASGVTRNGLDLRGQCQHPAPHRHHQGRCLHRQRRCRYADRRWRRRQVRVPVDPASMRATAAQQTVPSPTPRPISTPPPPASRTRR
jgi:hypothetical protein